MPAHRLLLLALLPLLGCYPFDTPPPGELPPASDQGLEPVEALYDVDRVDFEGREVLAHFPQEPTAMAFVFHGTQGSAQIAHKVEVVDVLNDLVAAGLGFVATESDDRENMLRWQVDSVELDKNVDLSRLFRLRQDLIDSGRFDDDTPLVALGMSNGASFAGVFGRAAQDAGWPIRALSLHCGPLVPAARGGDGLRVPTLFVIAANDSVVNNEDIRDHHEELAHVIDTEWYEATEAALHPHRFMRIEGIEQSHSEAIFGVLEDAGVVDQDGVRLVGLPGEAEAMLATIDLAEAGSGVTEEEYPQQVKNQLKTVWAEHTFSAGFKAEEVSFLLEQLEAE